MPLPMLTQLLLLVGFVSAGLSTAGAADPAEESSRQIRAALEQWTADFNAGNRSRVCDLFAPDLISNFRGAPERDYQALCDNLQKSLADPTKTYHNMLELREIIVSGDLAVVRLVWHSTVKLTDSGVEESDAEPGLDVFRRQPDGSWKIARFIAYPVGGP
jgi:uncharacterized protein (TIGR02246 family)